MTRPAYHVDVATTALTNIAQPAGAIQTSGFPANSKFASAYANWLFRRLGEWARDLDAAGLRAAHWLDSATPQLVEGNGVSFPIGAGLGPLTPDDGGIYYLEGLLVDLSAAAIAAKYPGAFTFAPGSTTYIHARVDSANSGSSYGELYASTNLTEPGYTAVAAVSTDATDVTSVAGLAQVKRFTLADQVHQGDVTHTGSLTASGAAFSCTAPAAFSNTVSAALNSASTVLEVTQAGSGYGADVLGSGSGTSARIRNTGSGTALEIEGNNGATAVAVAAGSNQGGLLVTGLGAAAAVTIVGGSSGVEALSVAPAGGNTDAILATGAGTGSAVNATSGTGASSAAVSAAVNSTTGRGIYALGSATGGATGSRGIYTDGQQGAGLEARSSAYYAAIIQGDTTSPTYPALRVIGQDADPGDQMFGNIVAQSTHNQWRYSVAGYGYRGIMSMGPGSALYVVSSQPGTEYTENAGTFTTITSVLADTGKGQGYYGQAAGAQILIRVTMEARSLTAAANIVNAKLLDTTNTVTIATRSGAGPSSTSGFELLSATTTYQKSISWAVSYSPPAEGDLTIALQIQRGTANGIRVRDVTLEILGTF